MENQKIQQLIRLASIADKNGDYKIADKIFNKLAAAPPMIRRYTDPAKIRELMTSLGKLDQLNTLLNATNIQSLLDNMVVSSLSPTVANFEAALKDYERWEAIADPATKRSAKTPQFEYFEKNYESLKFLYDNLIKAKVDPNEVLTKVNLRKKITDLLGNIDFNPDVLKNIPPQEKAILERIKAEMQLTDAGAAQKAREKILSELTPRQIQEGTNKGFAFWKSKVNRSATENVKYETVVADINAIKLNKQLTQQQKNELLSDLLKTSKALGVELKKQEKELTKDLNVLQRIFTRRFSDSAKLSAKLKELLGNYDKVFYNYFKEELAIQTSKRQKAVTEWKPALGGMKPKPFDINDENDFKIVLEAAYNKSKDCDFSAQVRSLVETIESNIKTEIEVAKGNLTNKKPSSSDIYTDIIKRNPNLPKTLNFDKLSFEKIIGTLMNDENLSIEQVMSITQGSLPWFKTRIAPFLINGLKNNAWTALKIGALGVGGYTLLSLLELTPLRPMSNTANFVETTKQRIETESKLKKDIDRAKKNETGIFGGADPRKLN